MKWFATFSFFLILLFSCKEKSVKTNSETNNLNNSNSFVINGTFENFFTKKVYLNKIIENSLYPIDSVEVLNNSFTFQGQVEYPERFAFTYQSYASLTIFILENKKIKIHLNGKNIQEPIINNSPLNKELASYKTNSKKIFKKIDFLFPQFQKARLENDVEKLTEIGLKMKDIENEFTKFTFNYIQQNKASFVSAMLLRDQLKVSTVDTLKITEMYKSLSSEVKRSPDAEIVATYFNLH